jgi:hypothetical protein
MEKIALRPRKTQFVALALDLLPRPQGRFCASISCLAVDSSRSISNLSSKTAFNDADLIQ